MQVTVLGAGAWGTAISLVLAEKELNVTLWTWEAAHEAALKSERENRAFLPGFALPSSLTVTSDLHVATAGADVVIFVVPSHALRKTAEQVRPFLSSSALVVCASKGIEEGTHLLLTQVLAESLGISDDRLAVLSGPSFAKEVAKRVPTNLVAASSSEAAAKKIQDLVAREWLRVYTSSDPVGVEIGGALKNVIAIAAGACDGFGLGYNTRAALMTRGVAEMARLATKMGGEMLTVAGLSGIGDLVLTCTGELSRNRTLGYKLGQGETVEAALKTSDGVAEGYLTSRSAVELARKLGVQLPICEAVHSVLHGGTSPKDALQALLSRPLGGEWG